MSLSPLSSALFVPHSTSYSHARPHNHGWVLCFSFVSFVLLVCYCRPGTHSQVPVIPDHQSPLLSHIPPNAETFLDSTFFPPRFLSLLPFTLCISFRYNSFCEILTRPADVYRPDDSYRPYQVSCSVSVGVFLLIFPHYAHPRLLRKRECVVSAGAETASAIGSDLPIYEIPRARPSRIAIWVLDSKRIAPCRQQCAPVALSSNPERSSVEIS